MQRRRSAVAALVTAIVAAAVVWVELRPDQAERWVAIGTFVLALGTVLLAEVTHRGALAAREEVEISRRALQAGSRPLLADAALRRPYPAQPGASDETGVPRFEANVYSDREGAVGFFEAEIPLQNVGPGLALIKRFRVGGLPPNSEWRHAPSQSVVPSGDPVLLRVSGELDPGDAQAWDDGVRFEHIEFEVDVWYTDVAGEQPARTRLLIEGDGGRFRPTLVSLYEGEPDAEHLIAELRREVILLNLHDEISAS